MVPKGLPLRRTMQASCGNPRFSRSFWAEWVDWKREPGVPTRRDLAALAKRTEPYALASGFGVGNLT